MEAQVRTQAGKQVQPRIGTGYIPKASSKDPIIATVYKPYGDKKKPGSYPGFQEDFVLELEGDRGRLPTRMGKKPPAPEPVRKNRIGFDLGGDTAPAYKAPKRPPMRDYGKDSQDLEELIER